MSFPSSDYIVICRADRKDDGSPGDYELATRTVFPIKEDAEKYASGISTSRDPIIVPGHFRYLRFK
jgi:hypothetical protein